MEDLTICVGDCTHSVPWHLARAQLLTLAHGCTRPPGGLLAVRGEVFQICAVLCPLHVLAQPTPLPPFGVPTF